MPISTRGLPRAGLGKRLFLPASDAREQRGVEFAADRPAAVPEVEARPLSHRVLLGGGERRQGADVAPVARLLVVLHSGNAVLREIIGIHVTRGAQARQDVPAEIGVAAPARV